MNREEDTRKKILQEDPLFNRELQWLAFNDRVLEEAEKSCHPLLERVKFLSIYASNLQEFFIIRFAGVCRQILRGIAVPSKDGLSPPEQMGLIRETTAASLGRHRTCWIDEVFPLLREEGICIEEYSVLSEGEKDFLHAYFRQEILPVLTPQGVDTGRPFPHISSGSLNLLVQIRDSDGGEHYARIKVPKTFPRFVPLDCGDSVFAGVSEAGRKERSCRFVWLEDVVMAGIPFLFPGYEVMGAWPFQLLRDADLEIQEDEAPDLLETVSEVVEQRFFGIPVAILLDWRIPEKIRHFLRKHLELASYQIYPVDGRVCLSDLMELYGKVSRPDLKDIPFTPNLPKAVSLNVPFQEILRSHDLLLFHPYDSFSPVVDFLRWAARDPKVLAIKMTLYRVGKNSPIVEALMEARHNGKQVAVMVELKARFDEENNIVWARALERAGVHVVYGLVGLKVHAKMCLVIRREQGGIRRYVHLGTGNYNPSTAGIYTDVGLFSEDQILGEDVASLFNVITGYGSGVQYQKLLVAPEHLRKGILSRIAREVRHHREHGNGYLAFKMNSLVDKECILALYEASRAGVRIDLQVRGICCLVPGIPGTSDTIRITSIVGRFLEHSRLYYFRNGGEEELLLGSADLMERNMDRRVEVLFPVEDLELKKMLKEILRVHLEDNVQARELLPDGSYRPLVPGEEDPRINAQTWMLEHRGMWNKRNDGGPPNV